MATNQYLKMRKSITTMVEDYNEILVGIKTKDKWHSETINRLSKPFKNGCFTLAVAGEMSSGKSTFINTLLGKDILPTGHFQTTSAITYIEHNEKAYMKVYYAKGDPQIVPSESIKAELENLVALPEKYKDLPINDINTLIIGGDDVEVILKKKAGIERKTRNRICDESLWREYITTHSAYNIAEKVYIYMPLSVDMQGWRIIDTPGVNSIGGIQDETKKLFASRDKDGNKLVDAIIFLHRGDCNIQSESNSVFVENTINELTEEAKQRLFFVLTHATAKKFRQEKDEILKEAQGIYGNSFNIPKERITYVDSLIERFHKDVISMGMDVCAIDPDDAEPIEGWKEKDCDDVYELFSPLKKELKSRNLTRNNPNMLALMEEWGNFAHLKNIINNFVREVKESSYQKIIKLIIEDYQLISKNLKEEIEILKGGVNSIEAKREKLKQKKIEYNKILNKLRRLAATTPILEKFKFINEDLVALSQKKSVGEVRKAYQDILDKSLKCEKQIFEELKDEFRSYCADFDGVDVVLGSLDLDELENKAKIESTSKKDIYKDETYKEGFISPKTKTRQIYVRTDEVVDEAKKLREFVAYVEKEARPKVETFKNQLKEKVEELCELVQKEVNSKSESLENRLDELEEKLSCKDEEITILNSNVEIVNTGINKHNNQKYE